MAKAESDPFSELAAGKAWSRSRMLRTTMRSPPNNETDCLTVGSSRDRPEQPQAGDSKYHDLVTEMLETAIRRVGNEYADLLFEHDQQCREAEKQCEQLAAERMRKS